MKSIDQKEGEGGGDGRSRGEGENVNKGSDIYDGFELQYFEVGDGEDWPASGWYLTDWASRC